MGQAALTIGSCLSEPGLQARCDQWLKGSRHRHVPLGAPAEALGTLRARTDAFDALIFNRDAFRAEDLRQLADQQILFPAVVIGAVSGAIDYHPAEIHLPPDQLEQLSYSVDAAISRFLRRGRHLEEGRLDRGGQEDRLREEREFPPSWQLQRRLRERLGYLGVFYKRDPALFLRNLPPDERAELFRSLERTYRDLLLSYFRDRAAANQALESFVNTAFFSDLPITKTVEIHMNLIDRFWKQLRLEGHASDFLQDYRLALLDVMAHLCEMYRRCIPPEGQRPDHSRRAAAAAVAAEEGNP
jgi:circadian clock protein KaiA